MCQGTHASQPKIRKPRHTMAKQQVEGSSHSGAWRGWHLNPGGLAPNTTPLHQVTLAPDHAAEEGQSRGSSPAPSDTGTWLFPLHCPGCHLSPKSQVLLFLAGPFLLPNRDLNPPRSPPDPRTTCGHQQGWALSVDHSFVPGWPLKKGQPPCSLLIALHGTRPAFLQVPPTPIPLRSTKERLST